jgi:hypothetical protein
MRNLRAGLVKRNAEEGGAVLVIVALMLIAILGFVVIVVDVGGLLTLRRGLVRASDAGVLSAARSYALKDADSAQSRADLVARANVVGAGGPPLRAVSGIPGLCTKTDFSCGSVTARYAKNQQLYFAPIIGLGSVEDVSHTSKAIWGPAGAGVPITPLVASQSVFKGTCDIATAAPGANCYMWYRKGAEGRANSVGWLALEPCCGNKWGWDVPINHTPCPDSGASTRGGWLDTPVSGYDPLNWPAATYVCADTGQVGANWLDVQDIINSSNPVRSFPVNDKNGSYSAANGGTGLHGQSLIGDLKYDIVGFVTLKLVHLYDGDQVGPDGVTPVAGFRDPGLPVPCPVPSLTHDFSKGQPTTWDLDTDAGFLACVALSQSIDVTLKTPNGSAGKEDIDWSYDDDSHVFTWLKDLPNNGKESVEISLEYPLAGSIHPGICGYHARPKNQDKCLATQWVGVTVGGTNPGGGANFGNQAIRLAR